MLILTPQADSYAICKLGSNDPIPLWAFHGSLCSVTRTLDEMSIVCREASVPDDVEREGRWRCLKVEGPLDLSVTGILASLVTPLSHAGISIFALSTYQTDYLLVKAEALDHAIEVLRAAGHEVR
jgi:uncharacterized protein